MDLMVNIDVDDLERGIAFYTGAFGLRQGRRLGPEVAELLGGSAPLYLLARAAGTPAAASMRHARSYERHWTPVHLDFVVEDVDAATLLATRAGARLEDPVETHQWGRIAHLADPFGHGICLVQFLNRGYDEIASA